MTREEIIAQVNSLLAEEFEVEESEFTPDANLKETLSLDSINLVDLIALVQFNYKITIPVEDLKKIQTCPHLTEFQTHIVTIKVLALLVDIFVHRLTDNIQRLPITRRSTTRICSPSITCLMLAMKTNTTVLGADWKAKYATGDAVADATHYML